MGTWSGKAVPDLLSDEVPPWDPETRRFAQPEDRDLSPRERELFEDTFTRPVDFHSWRRACSQALANVGASAQQASTLAGHASLDAHQRYLNNTSKMAEVPAAALPSIRVLPQLVAKTLRLNGGGATRAVWLYTRYHWGLSVA
ncbi:MAG TPA: hypothetical protein VJV79_04065 [Polyangiaceae bacterium]|nr:hypothetical protein [Polyangiaceae bacterium]